MYKKTKEKFHYWNLDKKIYFLVSIIIVFTTISILIASAVSSFLTINRQANQMAEEQLNTFTNSLAQEFDNYNSLILALEINMTIQEYLNKTTENELYSDSMQAYNILDNTVNMNETVRFVTIFDLDSGTNIIKGTGYVPINRIINEYKNDYANSIVSGYGTLNMSYSTIYYGGENYGLSMYQPVYSTKNMVQEIGFLVLNVESLVLTQLENQNTDSEKTKTFLITREGTIFSPNDKYEVGSQFCESEKIHGKSGSFTNGENFYRYKKVGKWNFYLVNEMSIFELYGDYIKVLIILIALIVFMTISALVFVRKFVLKLYEPLDKVVSKMDSVADGKLEVRIRTENMGRDFEKLGIGFNTMMDEISVLVDKVKLEQHQLEQIRFNALQSQIQPHFLYNTLDCIHWQAIAEGNKEVSTLVKALAQYYRICLSNGKDIINLKMELEHIRNYLIIQNMRYDNIIESQISVDSSLYNIAIPKMTLQPLIENSIYHGIKVKEGKKGWVRVYAELRDGDIYITVADNGTGMTNQQIEKMNESISEYDDNFGYGVRNVNKRIELMYGEEYGLFYTSNSQGGVTVEIHLPNKTSIDYKEII